MGTVTLPYRPAGTDVRSVGGILDNFDAVLAELNGGLDGDNFSTAAALDLSAFGVTFGADVNLYRSAANILKTDDNLYAVGDLAAKLGGATTEVAIGARGPGGQAGITFGSPSDVNLYRSAADVLKTDDQLWAVGGITMPDLGVGVFALQAGLSGESVRRFRVGRDGTVEWGSGSGAVDTNLYRSAADTLKTDDSLVVAGTLTVNGATIAGASNRGAVSIPAAESTSSTSNTLLTTPDRIQNVVLPTNGLIVIGYQALWQNTVANNARAAIFIGANQLKVGDGGGPPVAQQATGPAEANDDGLLFTTPWGLTKHD
jgi:hypothetical protein